MKRFENFKLDSILRVLICFVAFVFICALLYCACFVFPSGDDYGYAYRVRRDGYLESYIDTYLSWSGRYMASLFSFLNPLLLDIPNFFPIYSVLLIIVFIASIYFFLHKLLYSSTQKAKLLATVLLICTLMAGMPSFFEYFFWFSAYISYTISCIAILLFVGLKIGYERNCATMTIVGKCSFLLFSSLLIIVIVGCNELTMIVIDCILIGDVVVKWKNKSSVGYVWGLLFVACLSSIVMIAAPGNYARLDISQAQIDCLHIILLSTLYTIQVFFKNLPLLAVMALVYIFFVVPLVGVRKHQYQISPLALSIFVIVVVWLMHVFLFLSVATCPLERTENVVFVFLVFSWSIILYLVVPNSMVSYMRTRQSPLASFFVIILFLFFMFRYDSAINATFADILSGNVTQFAKERQNQIEMLKKSQSPQTVLPSLTVAPKTLTYTLYDEKLGLNVVILPGDEYYGSEAVFLVDTIRVQDSRVIWSKIKTDWKKRINR